MRLSRFTRFVRHGDAILAFNALSCGFAHITPETYEALQSIRTQGFSLSARAAIEAHLPELQRGKFVIDDEEDEIATLRVLHNRWKYDTSTLDLTIAPTLACNFRCQYCFEGELPAVTMSQEIQEAIVEFVSKRAKGLRRLSVCWYGGEPLLAAEIVYQLSQGLIGLCATNDCAYQGAIITNGWLLDQETAQRLRDCQVQSVQVTLDGPPAVHDGRRPLKNGSGTFERILENINKAADILHLVTRINVDQSNSASVLELMELLHQRGVLTKINPYLGRVVADTQACADLQSYCYDAATFAELEIKVYEAIRTRRLTHLTPYPRPLPSFCGATKLQSFLIDPSGNLYKCWNVIGNEREAIGHILKPDVLSPRLFQWLDMEPFAVQECRDCNVLPLCAGGCPYYYHQRKYEETGKPACYSWRYMLDDMLRLRYESWSQKGDAPCAEPGGTLGQRTVSD